MPIYEYKCTECGHQLEAIQKMSEDLLKDCPECHKPALQRLLSAAGFQLKGTGWYATDFKGGDKKKDSNKSASDGSSGASSSSEPSTPAPEKKAQAGGDGGCH